MSAVFVVATSVFPPIVCPSWCTWTEAGHQEDLLAWEGRVLHRSAEAHEWCLVSTTSPDGHPWLDAGEEPVMVHVLGEDRDVTLDEATARLAALYELLRQGRAAVSA